MNTKQLYTNAALSDRAFTSIESAVHNYCSVLSGATLSIVWGIQYTLTSAQSNVHNSMVLCSVCVCMCYLQVSHKSHVCVV